MTKLILSSFVSLFAASAWAQHISYQAPEILARASMESTLNLPAMSFLNSTSVALNNAGDVSFRIMAVEGRAQQGIWYKAANDKVGKVVYVAPEDYYVAEPVLNNKGEATFNLFTEAFSEAIFIFNPLSSKVEKVLDGSKDQFYSQSFVKVLDSGDIIFRGTTKKDDRGFFMYRNGLKTMAIEGEKTFGVPTSYLFKPVVNANGQWLFKMREGEHRDWGNDRSDQIVLLTPNKEKPNTYSKTLIAQDKNGMPDSKFVSLDNSPFIAGSGAIVFTAKLESKKKAIILHQDGIQTILAEEGKDGIAEFEMFNPKVNSNGVIAFRAKNTKGLRGIYVATKTEVQRVIGEGDMIPSDLGPQYVMMKQGFPGFAGDVEINDRGDIAFAAVVSSLLDKHLGDAVYILRANPPQ